MLRVIDKIMTDAGVSVIGTNPFASIEINDQKGGVNGIVTDVIRATAYVRRSKGKKIYNMGILGHPVSKTFSTAYAN